MASINIQEILSEEKQKLAEEFPDFQELINEMYDTNNIGEFTEDDIKKISEMGINPLYVMSPRRMLSTTSSNSDNDIDDDALFNITQNIKQLKRDHPENSKLLNDFNDILFDESSTVKLTKEDEAKLLEWGVDPLFIVLPQKQLSRQSSVNSNSSVQSEFDMDAELEKDLDDRIYNLYMANKEFFDDKIKENEYEQKIQTILSFPDVPTHEIQIFSPITRRHSIGGNGRKTRKGRKSRKTKKGRKSRKGRKGRKSKKGRKSRKGIKM